MRRQACYVIALCLVATAAALALRPSPSVRLQAVVERMPPAAALAWLKREHGAASEEPAILATQAGLALDLGDATMAIAALRRLARLTAHRPYAEDRLAEITADIGNLRASADHRLAAYEAAPNAARLVAALTALRLLRDREREADLLRAADPSLLPPELAKRHLRILLDAGDVAAAEALLRARQAMPPATSGDARVQLADLLIGTGRAGEAIELARGWLKQEADVGSFVGVVDRLMRRDRAREAVDVAAAAVADGLASAPLAIPRFAASHHGWLARVLMETWLAGRVRLEEHEQDVVEDYLEARGDVTPVLALLHRARPATLRPSLRLRIIGTAYQRFGVAVLARYRSWLTPAVLASDHIMAAELLIALGDGAEAARQLEAGVMRRVDAGRLAALFARVAEIPEPAAKRKLIDAFVAAGASTH